MTTTAQLACFESEDAAPTLLLEAGEAQLRELQSIFEALASGRLRRVVFHTLPFLTARGGVELRALRGEEDAGIRRDVATRAFAWQRSGEGWRHTAAKVAALLASDTPDHRRLDPPGSEVLFLLSREEYGEDWWSEHS